MCQAPEPNKEVLGGNAFNMNATEACIALNMLPTVGPVRLRKLLEVFNGPQQILAAKRGDLCKVEGIGNEVADQISKWESTVDLAVELERIREFGVTVITQDSHSYPKPLREIHAPPIVLYVWGELEDATNTPSASSVPGERRITVLSRRRNSLTSLLMPD